MRCAREPVGTTKGSPRWPILSPTDLATALTSRGQAPVIALVLILATTVGMLNLSSRQGRSGRAKCAPPTADAAAGLPGPTPKAGAADGSLEAFEPLLRFLNLDTTPGSLEELAVGWTATGSPP